MFRTSSTPSRTSQSPTLTWSVPSQKGRPGHSFEPSSGSADLKAKTEITVLMPNGDRLNIQSDQVTINFDRDFQDITTRADAHPVYMVDRGTVTIVAKL